MMLIKKRSWVKGVVGLGIIVGAGIVGMYLNSSSRISTDNVSNDMPGSVSLPSTESRQSNTFADIESAHDKRSGSIPGENPSGIIFPDGTNIKINWRWPSKMRRLLTEPLGQHYESLKQQALAGDPHAAFDIYRIGDTCFNAVETESELHAVKNKLLETHRVVLPAFGEKELYVEDPDSIQNAIAMFQMDYDRCIGVTAAIKSERSTWLEMAKDGGPPLATFLYASQLSDTSEAILYLQKAWESGFTLSLPLMAEKLLERYESGEKPSDNIRAYATQFAYSALLENRRREFDSQELGSDAPIGSKEESANKTLKELASSMHDYEIEEAVEAAKELITSNPDCCFAF